MKQYIVGKGVKMNKNVYIVIRWNGEEIGRFNHWQTAMKKARKLFDSASPVIYNSVKNKSWSVW